MGAPRAERVAHACGAHSVDTKLTLMTDEAIAVDRGSTTGLTRLTWAEPTSSAVDIASRTRAIRSGAHTLEIIGARDALALDAESTRGLGDEVAVKGGHAAALLELRVTATRR